MFDTCSSWKLQKSKIQLTKKQSFIYSYCFINFNFFFCSTSVLCFNYFFLKIWFTFRVKFRSYWSIVWYSHFHVVEYFLNKPVVILRYSTDKNFSKQTRVHIWSCFVVWWLKSWNFIACLKICSVTSSTEC